MLENFLSKMNSCMGPSTIHFFCLELKSGIRDPDNWAPEFWNPSLRCPGVWNLNCRAADLRARVSRVLDFRTPYYGAPGFGTRMSQGPGNFFEFTNSEALKIGTSIYRDRSFGPRALRSHITEP